MADETSRTRWPKTAVALVIGLTIALAAVSAGFYLSTLPVRTPGGTVPAAPGGLVVAVGDGSLTFSFEASADADGHTLYLASEPGVTQANFASKPDGARYLDIASPYTVSGLVNGRTYYARLTAINLAGESEESSEVSSTPTSTALPPPPLYVTGSVESDTGAVVAGAAVTVRSEDGASSATGVTAADGRYTIKITPAFPTRVLAKVVSQRAGEPAVTGFRWSPIQAAEGAVDVGRIVLPAPAGREMGIAAGTATSADGHVVATDLPPEVASLWAKDYEPDLSPDVFPGDLAEERTRPINSVTFVWISALDASGTQVFDLSAPATVRLRVFPTQWLDLDDLQPGNGVIDTPIYSMDYATGYWVREPDGRLTDAAGNAIAESEEAAILRGTYGSAVYAEFQADHFSWWNVDKPPTGCGQDFGDAPDPTYPSLLASDGARHATICRAWLGPWADGESDADVPNLDRYDDGVLDADPLTLRVSNWDWPDTLYLNVLIDRNGDGDWEDTDEWAIQNLTVSVPRGKSKAIETDIAWDAETWMRVTLTGDPIDAYDGRGAFAIGETEDYPFLEETLRVEVTGNGTVTSDPPGIDCRKRGNGTCTQVFRHGSSVVLTAMPDPGDSFIGWGGDCRFEGTNSTCTLIMDDGRFATASFTQPYWDLSVFVYGNGTVTSDPPGIDCDSWNGSNGTNPKTCVATFPRDTVVTLTATPGSPDLIVRWYEDCDSSGSNLTCTLLMDRDRFAGAQFRLPYLYISGDRSGGNGTVTSDPPGIDCHLPGSDPGGNYTDCFEAYPRDTLVTLTATPDPGFVFLGWEGDCTGSAPTCTVLMDRDRFVTARFG